jgi:hypothetical protein
MLLFSLIAVLAATAGIVRMFGELLPAMRGAQAALAECPAMREFRFRIVETQSRWNDGNVVALPLRSKALLPHPESGLRAAA